MTEPSSIEELIALRKSKERPFTKARRALGELIGVRASLMSDGELLDFAKEYVRHPTSGQFTTGPERAAALRSIHGLPEEASPTGLPTAKVQGRHGGAVHASVAAAARAGIIPG